MPEAQEEIFAAHSAWVAGLRAQYEAATSGSRPAAGGVQPSGFGGSGDFGMVGGEPQLQRKEGLVITKEQKVSLFTG